MIIDAQVHGWAPDSPAIPWRLNYGSDAQNEQVRRHFSHEIFTHERVVSEMNAVGVDAAVFVNPGIYAGDLTYASSAAQAHPGRLGLVSQVDPDEPDSEGVIHQWQENPDVVAVRVTAYSDQAFEAIETGTARGVVEAADRHGLVVNVYVPGYLARFEGVARAFPGVQFVIDHLGLKQPPVFADFSTGDPFGAIDELLNLARYPNVAVKATGVPSLSNQAYPFQDVWPHLHRVFDAFGLDRVLWGTDFTRVVELVTYAEGVDYVRESDELSPSDKEQFMGGALKAIYGWPSQAASVAGGS